MRQNFTACLQKVLEHEGGYVNHPLDPGGMTNLGVTARVWSEWLGREASEKDMRNLTPEKVAPLYKRKYWDRIGGDDLPIGVDYAVFDAAVNSGPGNAAKWLQRCLKVTVDGGIGPKTIAAAKAADPIELIHKFNNYRLSFLIDLPTWATFHNGWARRVTEVQDYANQMTDVA